MFERNMPSLFFVGFVFSAFLASSLQGRGFFIIQPMPSIAEPVLKTYKVDVLINNQIATTKIDQVFENASDQVLEGMFVFPLPDQADVHDFTMHVNNEPVKAEIFNKDEASKIYENIVRQRKDPALLEYVGHGMCRMRVYPIPANGKVRISLSYTQVLKADNGTVKYHYLLGAEKVFAGRLEDFSMNVSINAAGPIANIHCPTHNIEVTKASPTKAVVTHTSKNVRLAHDFILYYSMPKDDMGITFLTYKDGKKQNEDGFFLAMISPAVNKQIQQPAMAKNIVFVVDTSGSMSGQKIEQARNALTFCLQNLNVNDFFNIISFNSSIDMYSDCLVCAAHTQVEKALNYVKSLQADNCTNIDLALKKALNQFSENNNPNMIIFLTDGCPTEGETDITRIIENVKKTNTVKARLFSFGVGYDVNTTLLDTISLKNKGTSDYVRPNESVESVVTQFYKKVSSPVLTDLQMHFVGTRVKEIFPVDLPDLFEGSQLLVAGRYTKGGAIDFDLEGKQGLLEKHFMHHANFATDDTENNFLPRMWAGRKIAYLVDKIVLEGENKELVEEIIKLSRKYGIITRYTSFLIDDKMGAEEFMSDFVSLDQMDMAYESLSTQEKVGKNAFSCAKSQQSLRESTVVAHDDATREKMCMIGVRTFYQKNKVWIDADHTDASTMVKIKFFSPEYFALVATRPDVRACLALGCNVIIKTDVESIYIYDEEVSAQ